MQVGIIAPIKFLDKYCTTGLSLCYASFLEETEYRKFFEGCEDVVVLDHSPQIPRGPEDFGQFDYWVQYLRPDLVVLPNYDFLCKKTVKCSTIFVEEYWSKADPVSRIGVLQGTSIEDLKFCFRGLKEICEVWGLPSSLESIAPREDLVEELELDRPVLYLEVNKDPLGERPEDLPVPCLGVLTSFPLRLAYEGRNLAEIYRRPKPLDFYLDKEEDPDLASKNVEIYLKTMQ